MRVPFVKMEGAGNDYVFVDAIRDAFPFERAQELARAWSDRRFGIGSDGLIALRRGVCASVAMSMWNADGSEGAMCGNGLRCLAALAREHKVRRAVYGAAITAGPLRERQYAARILGVNAVAAVALYQALAGPELARFVYLSSVAVYGAAGYGDAPTVETVEPVPDSLYAISKYTTARSLARLRDASRGDAVCLRLGPAFGPWEYGTGLRDTLSPPFELLRHARQGRTCVLPRAGIRDWIYAPDIAAAAAAVTMVRGRGAAAGAGGATWMASPLGPPGGP
jgi:UDP-glucose 4-epimerase